MRRFFWLVLLLAALPTASAQTPISGMGQATTPLGGDELVPIVQPGSCRGSSTCNKQVATRDLAAAFNTPDATQALPYTLTNANVGGLVALTGSGNFTLNAGTIPTGKYACYVNGNASGGGNATITGSATIRYLPSSTIYPGGGGCLVAASGGQYDWSPGIIGGDPALKSIANQFTAPQSASMQTVAIAGSTFTPDFSMAQHFSITLVHASCPCTIANPTNLPASGTVREGMIKIIQSGSGSDLVTTWGSAYNYVGGTVAISLSTTAGTTDYLPYHIDDGAKIILGGIVKGPTH